MSDLSDKTPQQKTKLVSSDRLSIAEKLELLEQQSKAPAKLIPSNNPYVLGKAVNSNEEVIGEYKSLEAKLDSYQPFSDLGDSIKKWVLIINAIVIPIIIGISASVYFGSSKSNTNLTDIAAAISSKSRGGSE